MGLKELFKKNKDKKKSTENEIEGNLNLEFKYNLNNLNEKDIKEIDNEEKLEMLEDEEQQEKIDYVKRKNREKLAKLADVDKRVEEKILKSDSKKLEDINIKAIVRISLVKGFLLNSRLIYHEKVYNKVNEKYNDEIGRIFKANPKQVIDRTIQLFKDEGIIDLDDGNTLRIPTQISKTDKYVKAGYDDYSLDDSLNLRIRKYVVEKGLKKSVVGNDFYTIYNETVEEWQYNKEKNCVEKQKYRLKHEDLNEQLYEENLQDITGCYVERQYLITKPKADETFFLESDTVVGASKFEYGEIVISHLDKGVSSLEDEYVYDGTKTELKRLKVNNVQTSAYNIELKKMQKDLYDQINKSTIRKLVK